MMILISSTAKGQRHIVDVGPLSLANFGILEEIHIDDRFKKILL